MDRRTDTHLLVRLQQLEEFEADPHPLSGGDVFRASVGDSPHQIDAVLLHLLVSILEDRCETRQQILDGRRHFVHADHVDDALERAQNAAQHLGILFSQILVQDDAQMAHQLLLLTSFHDDGDAGDQISSLGWGKGAKQF